MTLLFQTTTVSKTSFKMAEGKRITRDFIPSLTVCNQYPFQSQKPRGIFQNYSIFKTLNKLLNHMKTLLHLIAINNLYLTEVQDPRGFQCILKLHSKCFIC